MDDKKDNRVSKEIEDQLNAEFDQPLVPPEFRAALRAKRMAEKADFAKSVLKSFWAYRTKGMASGLFSEEFFDENYSQALEPCVFKREFADHNVLLCPEANNQHRQAVLGEIPASRRDRGTEGGARHRWFRSMSSSQALAQSVFGNLKHHGKLHLLAELAVDGVPLFICNDGQTDCRMEYESEGNFLNEQTHKTSVDVFFPGKYQVAVECKFSEQEVGTCSRPRLEQDEKEYCVKGAWDKPPRKPELIQRLTAMKKEWDMSGGNRTYLRDCKLSKIHIKYWEYIHELFGWPKEMTGEVSCPLRMPYQLVRNILIACIRDDGQLEPANGHAVLLYDKRNPAFQKDGKGKDGKGRKAYDYVRASLKGEYSKVMKECTWQDVVGAIRGNKDKSMRWLTDALRDKYGIE